MRFTGSPNIRTSTRSAAASSSSGYKVAGSHTTPRAHTNHKTSIWTLIVKGLIHDFRPYNYLVRSLHLFTCAIALSLAACANLSEAQKQSQRVKVGIVDAYARTRNNGPFDLIRPGSIPSLPVQEIAVLTYAGGASDEAQAIGAMVERARQLGAEGMILQSAVAPNGMLVGPHPIWQSPSERIFRASAFNYIVDK